MGVWLGLPLITLGIYVFVWYYKVNNEARRYLQDPSIRPGRSLLAITLGWLIIVPPYISIYRTAQRIQRMQANANVPDRAEPWIALLLTLVAGLYPLYLQIQLNKIWDAYLGRTPAPSAYPTPLPPPTPSPPAVSPPPPSAG